MGTYMYMYNHDHRREGKKRQQLQIALVQRALSQNCILPNIFPYSYGRRAQGTSEKASWNVHSGVFNGLYSHDPVTPEFHATNHLQF